MGNKCEWKDGMFIQCGGKDWYSMNYHFCPFCGSYIRKEKSNQLTNSEKMRRNAIAYRIAGSYTPANHIANKNQFENEKKKLFDRLQKELSNLNSISFKEFIRYKKKGFRSI